MKWYTRRPLGLLLLGLVVLSLVPGCRQHSDSDDVQVRLINAVPDADALDVAVDGQRVWKGASYRSSTGYQGMAAGTYGVQVGATAGNPLLANRPMAFVKGRTYTVLALGLSRNAGTPAQVQVLTDNDTPPLPADKTGLRLINASPGGASLDLVVNNIVGMEAVRYGRRSPVLLLDGGIYDLKVAEAGTANSLAGPVSLHLEPGRTYTLVAMGNVGDQPMTLEAYPDSR